MYRYCSQCGKSHKACICRWIESLSSNVELIILQHATESNRPMGTAKILTLSLDNSYCFVGEDFTQHRELNALLTDSTYSHYIMYPCDHSQCVSSLVGNKQDLGAAREEATSKKIRVILLDGTWKKAYKMWQLSENLQGLPMLHLPKGLKGNYRIRKAPSDNSLSTVEAGYYVLSILQPERDFSPLQSAFDNMIQFYIDQMPEGVFERNYKKSLSE
ncbi:tRNA-uridine aminocarboxypropyltransferase [uncultured Vibrio sp.]|uniref:tRNA-uridine aminocarboxypropyltransferase n=1 Tax=uncultured Vibrio sp. TaxID=114054 RepID=UPI000923708C|nr:DTW domain-containing protein [uncultured Vibrio sp.]OIQ24763.1 MAG: DTW domain-containing protein [Vibrio sp. MedPE-SWchi]